MKTEKEIKEKLKHIRDLNDNKDFNDGFFSLNPEIKSAWDNALEWVLNEI